MSRARHLKKNPARKRALAIWIVAAVFAAGLVFTNAAILCQGTSAGGQDAGEMRADCILVLGARVDGNVPSVVLQHRLETGVELYRQGIAPRLLLTGDGGQHRYDEVSVMVQYAQNAGVPAGDIMVDREGFNTYASFYRAKAVYGIESAVVVTQSYHMARALYDARALGLKAEGVEARGNTDGQWFRDLREVAARAKDYVVCMLKPAPGMI